MIFFKIKFGEQIFFFNFLLKIFISFKKYYWSDKVMESIFGQMEVDMKVSLKILGCNLNLFK
jgi:hypothetical protein